VIIDVFGTYYHVCKAGDGDRVEVHMAVAEEYRLLGCAGSLTK
jgi:hypothetical protein